MEFDCNKENTIFIDRNAKAFKYILENKAISIGDGELIVGARGPAPKATST